MTANATGKTVVAGPDEATVLGNVAVQLIAAGEIADVAEARRVVEQSTGLKRYEPQDTQLWQTHFETYQNIMEGR